MVHFVIGRNSLSCLSKMADSWLRCLNYSKWVVNDHQWAIKAMMTLYYP